MERKRRISAPFLRTGLNNYRQSKTAAQPENTIIALIQAGIADNIFSPIILRCPDAGRNDSRVVVLSHFMIDGVELLIVPVIVVEHCSRGIIWHQNTGYTTKVLIHVNVSGDPRTLLLVDESLCKCQALFYFVGMRTFSWTINLSVPSRLSCSYKSSALSVLNWTQPSEGKLNSFFCIPMDIFIENLDKLLDSNISP